MAKLCSLIAFAFTFVFSLAYAADPDILDDFLVPPGVDPNTITRQYFTYTGLRQFKTGKGNVNLTGETTVKIARVTKKVFPALEGLGVSVFKRLYPPLSVNPPHYHPRAAELIVVLDGPMEVGFVDSTNKLFVQTLQQGDLFVVPKGLVHFEVYSQGATPQDDCGGGGGGGAALAVFGSSNPGIVSLPTSLFQSGIKTEVLAKAFKIDEETVGKIMKANSK
ncbi:hypothetical protein Pint_15751 [Pistacia integerrima]|uniref:Uncharacterized protein n=1 Tax=Pistacia integerrima TaxID=434235 RepID=A0ACC0Z8Y7_9ROSI|nr:hypothetical protein Pint_15751 [Pistacia integerrima]